MIPDDKKTKTANIYAAEKIIADISSGLYRSPAAALKELVANAYDADAEEVHITTDAPKFRNLVISDNGTGMSVEHFLTILQHIGGSRKRIERDITPLKGRKIIGRIGIGLLAVAQLGYRFYVTSSQRGSKTRFIAEVNLEAFHKDDAALKSMGKIKEEGEVQIGAVTYVDDIPEEEDAQYTVITIPDAKKGLISEMTGVVRAAVGAQEQLSAKKRRIKSFDELIDVTRSSQRAIIELDSYYYMLWELALLCPINYSDRGPFEEGNRHIEDIDKFRSPVIKDFKVFVDGIELRRPQLFPNPRAFNYSSPDPKIYTLDFDRPVSGRKLRFFGYIYTQQPRIDPEELRGIHIRIRNVGIGKYDRTWLGYPFNEGQKFGQITGEIYVEDGLEPALNIDRDSFRETDVHYQAMRAYIWETLNKTVFPDFKQRQKKFSAAKKVPLAQNRSVEFTQSLLDLPAPMVDDVRLVDKVEPTLSDWIATDGTTLTIETAKWEKFSEDNGLVEPDAKSRFLRVVVVLISNELLVNTIREETEPLLRALANAVK